MDFLTQPAWIQSLCSSPPSTLPLPSGDLESESEEGKDSAKADKQQSGK